MKYDIVILSEYKSTENGKVVNSGNNKQGEPYEHFLAEKYSDFYIELDKLKNWKKSDLEEKYHELWDLCVIMNTKIKNQDEVIKMQAVQSPLALDFAQEVKKAVAPNRIYE